MPIDAGFDAIESLTSNSLCRKAGKLGHRIQQQRQQQVQKTSLINK